MWMFSTGGTTTPALNEGAAGDEEAAHIGLIVVVAVVADVEFSPFARALELGPLGHDPAGLGHDPDRRDPGVILQVEVCGQVGDERGPCVGQRGKLGHEGGGVAVVGAEPDGGTAEVDLHGREVHVVVEEEHAPGAGRRHAVVGDDHEIGRDADGREAVADLADPRVEQADGGGELG